MIVPMKKAAVIVQAKDAQDALVALRRFGAFHVEHAVPPAGGDLEAVRAALASIESALTILENALSRDDRMRSAARTPEDWRAAVTHIIDCRTRIDQLEEYQRRLRGTIADWSRWGEFDPADIAALAAKGVEIRLCQVPDADRHRAPAGAAVETLFRIGKTAFAAVITRGRIELPFKEILPPKIALSRMRQKLAEDAQAIAALRGEVRRAVCYYGAFQEMRARLARELEFGEALAGMGSAGRIAYLTGYVPATDAGTLGEVARRERWGLVTRDPGPDDRVPTLIRNPRWIALVAPVFKMIEIVPGYNELDISLWFLVFFSVFFGMLIGDAGIGGIFFILTVIAQRRFGAKTKDASAFILFYLLSLCAVVWGVLSGTYFGQAWIPPSFKFYVPALRDDRVVQTICFLLGAVHLSGAHLWRAALKAPSPKALADLGWAAVVWGMFFLAKTLVLGETFPAFGRWFFIAGPLLVVVCTEPRRNILAGIGAGAGALLLNLVNNFTDVVSYIRLFAVGLATVAVADSFNRMALDIGFGSFGAGMAAACILVIGHGLNVVLGPLSVLVHGVRLNVLEFCTHLDIKWSGFAYRPLRDEG